MTQPPLKDVDGVDQLAGVLRLATELRRTRYALSLTVAVSAAERRPGVGRVGVFLDAGLRRPR